jgi:DNA repair protein RecO (recombination protein O)
MYYVKECVPNIIFSSIGQNPTKSAVTIFLAEVLYRTVKEQHCDSRMFAFAIESILFLDTCNKGIMNFPILFLLKLSGFLGFFPNIEKYEKNAFFDLKNGNISKEKPMHPFFLSEIETFEFVQLMRLKYETMHILRLTKEQRDDILDKILLYLHLHLSDFGMVKSVDVLKAIW